MSWRSGKDQNAPRYIRPKIHETGNRRTYCSELKNTQKMLNMVQVLQRYQEVPAGSRASKLPLLELVAVAIHHIAAELFRLDGAFHKRDTPCTSLKGDEGDDIRRCFPPWPTTFAVVGFTDTERFPAGIADVAGYWAEDVIFGGVVLFGRGESGTGVSNPSAAGTKKFL